MFNMWTFSLEWVMFRWFFKFWFIVSCKAYHIFYNAHLNLPPSQSPLFPLIHPSFKCVETFWVQNLLIAQKDL
jgi:hypothetical protein